MGILNRLFRKKEKSFRTDSKRNESQQREDRLIKNTPFAIVNPPEESPEKSLRSDFLKAIDNEEVENVKAALEAGADPNWIVENEFVSEPGGYPFKHGENPLDMAASGDNADILKILLGTGAYSNWTINGALLKSARWGNAEKVEVLLGAGADPNYRDSYGRDALINAALSLDSEYQDQLPVIEKLLKSGADPNHTENNFQSAIQLAAYHGHIKAVKMILNSGLITETFNLKKALDSAKNKGNQEICVLVKNYIEKVDSETEPLISNTNIDTTEDTTTEKTIYFGEMMTGRTVDVTISVEGFIHGSDLYGGKYHAKLPVNMISDQLLNHIADKIGIIASFHMGYMLLLNGETILTCREKKALRETDVKDGDILTFIDWG